MERVLIKDKNSMNLFGLFVASILRRSLQSSSKLRQIRRLRCTVLLQASGMKVTARFKDGEVEISSDPTEHPTASVSGSLDTLLKISLGQNFLGLLFTRQIKVKGNLFILLKLLGVMRISEYE